MSYWRYTLEGVELTMRVRRASWLERVGVVHGRRIREAPQTANGHGTSQRDLVRLVTLVSNEDGANPTHSRRRHAPYVSNLWTAVPALEWMVARHARLNM